MNPKVYFPSILTLLLAMSPAAFGGEFVMKTYSAGSYDESRDRRYQVYIPDAYTEGEPVPMVMVLHGCNQTEQNMINETRFRELADRENFIVVYPFITSFSGFRSPNCWGFFVDEHVHEGAGEAEDLYRIGLEVESEYSIDPNRRYVTGLSSGGGMAVALAVAQNEYFAAAGSAEGLPYSETSSSVGFACANPGTFRPIPAVVSAMQAEQSAPDEARAIPFMAIHSTNDCTVNIQGSENIRDSWIRRYGADSTPYETISCTAEGVSCTHRKFGVPGRSVVETVFYNGETGGFTGRGSHYWVGDNSGEFANPRGPSASELFWDFFERHPFSDNPPPSIAIDSQAVDERSISISGTAADTDGTVAQIGVRLDGSQPQPERIAAGTTRWSVLFEDLADGAYTPVAVATDDGGATSVARGDTLVVGTALPPPSVTIDGVSVSGTCVAVNGTASSPNGAITAVEVRLGDRPFEPAELTENRYTYQECELPGGTYAVVARAMDALGLSATVTGETAEVQNLEEAVATWQSHLSVGRLRVYAAPCPNVGFGACDVDFPTLFLANGFNPFSLFRDPAADAWYRDPENIPGAASLD